MSEIEMDHIDPIIKAWALLEALFVELKLPPEDAERLSKVVVARLADHKPPILLAYPDQLKDE